MQSANAFVCGIRCLELNPQKVAGRATLLTFRFVCDTREDEGVESVDSQLGGLIARHVPGAQLVDSGPAEAVFRLPKEYSSRSVPQLPRIRSRCKAGLLLGRSGRAANDENKQQG